MRRDLVDCALREHELYRSTPYSLDFSSTDRGCALKRKHLRVKCQLAELMREHEDFVVEPLRELAFHLAHELRREANGYRLTRTGFGRLKRPAHKISPGESAFRDWVHLRAGRPSKSMFDENPGLYFYLSPDRSLAGGGLYEPSSRQIKKLRSWLADSPPRLSRLLKSKAFTREFPDGLKRDKVLKTFPRGYPIDHKRIQDLRLQAYYATRAYTKRELYSIDFKDIVTDSWRQALKLSEILFATWLDSSLDRPSFASATEDSVESESETYLWDDRL